ncbi:MAG: ComEC family competence protein [Candidatus Izimaplasma bacterium HR2]|nr:MAG: ComEC family competence protein [Candidatus Izimaplasma bacterium HR2]
MTLKILLQYRNRYLYIAMSLTLLILVINSVLYIIIAIPFLYYIYKNHSDLVKVILIFIGIYTMSLFAFNNLEIKEEDTYNVTVIKDIKTDNYTSFLGKINHQYIKVYFDENISIKPGDKLIIKGSTTIPSVSTIPNTFDYNNYLKSQNVKYTIFTDYVEEAGSSFSIYLLPYYIEKYIDKYQPLSGGYVKTFILAEKSGIDIEIKNQINQIGISHLFAVSGLHIAILVLTLEFFLKKTKLLEKQKENIIMALLLSYLLITSFSPSVTRASIMYVLLVVNKRYKLEFSSLDILSIIFIFLLFIRPYYYFDAGFLLSFLVTFTILFSSIILNKESKLHQLFLISFIAFLVTIPIILKLNHQINLLSLVFNIIFLMYVTYAILPLSYIAFLLPFFDKLNYVFIKIFEFILTLFSRIDILIFKFYFPNDITIIIYYVIVFFLLISLETNIRIKESLFSLILFLILIYMSPYFDFKKSVSFVDIYGDSILIKDSFNRCNILIDTGEYDDYDSLINYLKGKNIRKLDYLIISHFHSDHYGESEDILNEFLVDTVISKHNVLDYEDKTIQCGTIAMYIYPFSYKELNENNNSIIMSIFINDKHYLFTGDIEKSREIDFISEYNLDVDYLKVPHHGSITSSNQLFLDVIRPEEVFINVSVKNLHGHPHDEVIKRYEELGIIVYRTDLMGTIEVYYLFGKEYKRIHSP